MGFYLQWPNEATNLPSHLNKNDRIFSFYPWEANNPPREYFDYIEQIPNPVTLVLNSYNKHFEINSRCDVLYIDFFLYRTYREIVVLGKSPVNQKWNSQSNKFLFLTGKPQKVHRIGFLYALAQAGLSDKCVASLFINPYNKSLCQQILKIDNQEFEQFVAKFQGSPDFVEIPETTSIHYGGIPYNDKLFTTKFRVISESYSWYSPAWLTEKTWITILNRQPFLIAGDPGSCKKLQEMGFRTFDQFLITPYDNIPSWTKRQNAIIANIQHWLEKDLDMVSDIEHNYQQLIQVAKQNEDRIKSHLNGVGIVADISDVIPTFDDITGQ
jgi:hypothetical protein